MCTDRAWKAVRRKDDTYDWPGLDARNNVDFPLTFYEIVAEEFNDESNICTTEALPELPFLLTVPIDLYLHDMPGTEKTITAENVKTRFASCRAISEGSPRGVSNALARREGSSDNETAPRPARTMRRCMPTCSVTRPNA